MIDDPSAAGRFPHKILKTGRGDPVGKVRYFTSVAADALEGKVRIRIKALFGTEKDDVFWDVSAVMKRDEAQTVQRRQWEALFSRVCSLVLNGGSKPVKTGEFSTAYAADTITCQGSFRSRGGDGKMVNSPVAWDDVEREARRVGLGPGEMEIVVSFYSAGGDDGHCEYIKKKSAYQFQL